MKKFLLTTAIIAMTTTNTNASNYCIDWGDAKEMTSSNLTQAQELIASCKLENWANFRDGNCATFSPYTFIYKFEDGTCNRVDWCATCPSGYHLTEEFEEGWKIGDVCDTGDEDINSTIHYQPIMRQICEQDCASCTNCESDTSWTSVSTGYLKRTIRDCDCGTCVASLQYTCAKSYYGYTTNGTSGCTKCPQSDFQVRGGYASGTTDVKTDGGARYITNCYLPASTTYKDTYGVFEFKSKCYYSN